MLKILQARLQQYVNRELSNVQGEFRKGRGTKDQIANIHRIIEKAREFQKNIHFCFIDDAKAFDCVGHSKLWKILKGGNTRSPDLPLKKSVCRSAAAAAKSLQSCPTLCDSIDSSPPGSSIHGIFQQEHWSGLPFPSPMHESEK